MNKNNDNLPQKVYTAQQVRENEAQIAKQLNVSMYTLMERAGQAVFNLIQTYYPKARLIVFVGKGNNGGDGFVAARLAIEQGRAVTVIQLGSTERLTGDAKQAWQKWNEQYKKQNQQRQLAKAIQYDIYDDQSAEEVNLLTSRLSELLQDASTFTESSADNSTHAGVSIVIIDALLGTGVVGKPREAFATVINAINKAKAPVVSVDLPSGLNADTGYTSFECVNATHTISFVSYKQGLLTGVAKECCGKLHYDGLGIDAVFQQQIVSSVELVDAQQAFLQLPKRTQYAHKTQCGHILCIGGNVGMAGAIQLSATAALRSGAGLVSVATHPSNVTTVASAQPELMVLGIETVTQLQPLIDRASVVVFGPGLGRDEWAGSLWQVVRILNKPIIIDADGLYFLAQEQGSLQTMHQKINAIRKVITPHEGEAARLLNINIEDVRANRFSVVKELHHLYGANTLLKGAGSLIFDGKTTTINTTGNPAMASGGMGDTLSGIIAGLIGQGMPHVAALRYAVWAHGKIADDLASARGIRGLLASDIIKQLYKVVN
ncbi:NAD(P)H-hydrate dehydratase [Flocculibacter collagenilyticus]|uniref:NAD(P)H-hydrate dehydratase n=1 Tax=Flocculibacter collagenilyticus TaxID=2744479 RepID=UPI0018F6BF50|nr:NAD(P)H-hydrate dehydratase [Flocculibacter collagenilyticus]